MRAIVSVIGKDKLGIIAKVSGHLFELGINIEDISQTILKDYLTMMMLVDTSGCKIAFNDISKSLEKLGEKIGVVIRIQREDIFDSMHKV